MSWFSDRRGRKLVVPQRGTVPKRSSPSFREVQVFLGQGKRVPESVKTMSVSEVSSCRWMRARRPRSDLIRSCGRRSPTPRGMQGARACNRLRRRVGLEEARHVHALFPGRRREADQGVGAPTLSAAPRNVSRGREPFIRCAKCSKCYLAREVYRTLRADLQDHCTAAGGQWEHHGTSRISSCST